ncbi:hypothetical protein C8J57DRAFT_1554623 [Mycena rebaudengoi]|nr:hypothetical protein C8J57DRAFT_1554623 [Mycena rebaudengoi]
MADPITITTTVITLATIIKDLIEVSQNIKRSIEKVKENRRQIREFTEEILRMLSNLATHCDSRETMFQTPELLYALGELKADMIHVLSVVKKISPPERRQGLRGFSSQIKVWLKREDIEFEITIEGACKQMLYTIYEQRLIVNNEENRYRLRHLERMTALLVVHNQFGQNISNQTMEIVASVGPLISFIDNVLNFLKDPGHETLESQYLSVLVMSFIDSLGKYTATHYFQLETPSWDPVEEPLQVVFLRSTSALHILHEISGALLQLQDCPSALSMKEITEMVLRIGGQLWVLGMQSEATASDALAVQVFRNLASREFFTGCLPRLAFALRNLSYRYQYQLRHESAIQASEQSVYWYHAASERDSDVDIRAGLLSSLNAHSTSLRAAGQIDAAISAAQDALAICRALLPEASDCIQSFFCLSGALSATSRHREAYLASKEGLEIVARFSGSIPPPYGSVIDAFFNLMCKMAEAGEFDTNFLADVVILYDNLSRIYPQNFSKEFLVVLYAHAYFSNRDTAAMKDLRLFLEPNSDSPPPIMDDFSTSASWIDEGVVESVVHALYALDSALALDAVECFIAHLIHTHFDMAIQVLRRKVSSLTTKPVIDWAAFDITVYQTYATFLLLSRPERLLVLEALANLVDHARKNILSSSINWSFNDLLWGYCLMLRETACLSDALAIIEDAVRYNLSRTTPETDEVDWLCLQARVLVDAGHFSEAETVLRDAMKKWSSSDPHWSLTVVESSTLRQTGRVDQTLLLLENSTSSIAKDASAITTQGPHWCLYFLFSDLSSTQLNAGQTQNALETAEKAVIKCRELHLYHPHKLRPWIAVAYALTTLSNCLAAVGRTDEGLRAAQEAAAIYARPPWRGFFPWAYRPQDFASKAYHTLSLRLATSGQAEEALLYAEKAVGEYRDLVSLAFRPTPSLASSLRNLASRLWDVGRQEDSITALDEAVGILRQLVTNQSYLLSSLGDALEQLAMYLSEKGDAEGSSVAASECADIRARLGPSPEDLSETVMLEVQSQTVRG